MQALFSPRSVAVIGASRSPEKLGYAVLNNLRLAGFKGRLYPVNPEAKKILGLTCYPSINHLPEAPDLVVIVIPAPVVASVLTDCGKKGVKAAIIISAGFKEMDQAGAEREKQLVQIAHQYGIRLLGPNCLGFINTHHHLNASFASAENQPQPGSLALIAQSGALGSALLDMSVADPLLGVSSFISLGNKADINDADILTYLSKDKHTQVIAMYCEAVVDGPAFLRAAAQCSKHKPILMLKSGRNAQTAAAISSHTGSLAGNDVAYSAALAKAGVMRVDSFGDLIDLAKALTHCALPASNRVGIITNAGGPGILASDSLAHSGLELARFHRVTKAKLGLKLPPAANIHNPVDVLGDALSDRYTDALKLVNQDERVDMILIILTPQSMTEITETAQVIAKFSQRTHKPIVTCFMGHQRVDAGRDLLAEGFVPWYATPEQAVRALAGLRRYALTRERAIPTLQHRSNLELTDRNRLQHLLSIAQASNYPKLPADLTQTWLRTYHIPTPRTLHISTADDVTKAAHQLTYPVVLKLEHPQLIHKTEFKAVHLNLQSDQDVKRAVAALTKAATAAKLDHTYIFLLQEQLSKSLELFIGMKRDPVFGPLIGFGLGGIFVETLKDITFALAPLSLPEAHRLIEGIKSYPLLTGVRGQTGINIDKLAALLVNISKLSLDWPEISELDINPVIATPEKLVAVDTRLMLHSNNA